MKNIPTTSRLSGLKLLPELLPELLLLLHLEGLVVAYLVVVKRVIVLDFGFCMHSSRDSINVLSVFWTGAA